MVEAGIPAISLHYPLLTSPEYPFLDNVRSRFGNTLTVDLGAECRALESISGSRNGVVQ